MFGQLRTSLRVRGDNFEDENPYVLHWLCLALLNVPCIINIQLHYIISGVDKEGFDRSSPYHDLFFPYV